MFWLFGHLDFWQKSEPFPLPRIPADGDEALRDYCLIAGGLALLLSRCPPDAASRRFPAASIMYAALVKVHRIGPVAVDRELVSEVSHEVAEFTDRCTRDALLRRMRCLPETERRAAAATAPSRAGRKAR
ncbi:MAG: hypothetical protein JWQ07_2887 [Ramlibacter sp.]|nr:hypothetical protein [Ramlibacter sp.]